MFRYASTFTRLTPSRPPSRGGERPVDDLWPPFLGIDETHPCARGTSPLRLELSAGDSRPFPARKIRLGSRFKLPRANEPPTTHHGSRRSGVSYTSDHELQELTRAENRPTAFSKTPAPDKYPIHLPVHDVRTVCHFPSMAKVRRVEIRGRSQVGHRGGPSDGMQINICKRLQPWSEGGRIRLSEDDGPAATEFLDDDDDDDRPIALGGSLPDVVSEAHEAWEREESRNPSSSPSPTPAVGR